MLRAFFLPLVLTVIVASAQRSEAPALGSVEGIVVDAQGAIGGAVVFGLPEQDMVHQLRTTADDMGRYKLEGIPVGDVYMDAYKESDWYPYKFFSFFRDLYPPVKVNIEAGKTTTDVIIRLGPKAGRINFTITDEQGNHLAAGLSFTRDDMPKYGDYGTAVQSPHSMFVPPVPLRVTIDSEGYESWHSGVILPKSEKTLDIAVRLRRLSP
jgi:hypothetical protein